MICKTILNNYLKALFRTVLQTNVQNSANFSRKNKESEVNSETKNTCLLHFR